jgi:hypothetical protein
VRTDQNSIAQLTKSGWRDVASVTECQVHRMGGRRIWLDKADLGQFAIIRLDGIIHLYQLPRN